jgi:hypothetical protein
MAATLLKAAPSRARKTVKSLAKVTVKPKAFHKAAKAIKGKKPPKTAPQLVEVLVSFDTTGSMSHALHEVRAGIITLLNEMFRDVPNLRIGLLAHGDYCDKTNPRSYLTKQVGLTDDKKKLIDFVNTTGDTSGGDAAECYEHVLWCAKHFRWTHGSKRVLVMIGDDVPHAANDRQNEARLDWRTELGDLHGMGVQIYGVQAGTHHYAEHFWAQLGHVTGGHHLRLQEFSDVPRMIQGIARLAQGGQKALQKYQAELTSSGLMTRGLKSMYGVMAGAKTMEITHGESGAVASDKFKILNVAEDTRIDEFVKGKGFSFEPGRGFYQFTKSVLVQATKEIIVVDKTTGEIFSNVQARRLMGLPTDADAQVRPAEHTKYLCFIQSTSMNRKLIGGTKFLYEVSK